MENLIRSLSMQARVVYQVAGRRSSGCLSLTQARHASFIKEVMDQVKKDMAETDQGRGDWSSVERQRRRFEEKRKRTEQTVGTFGSRLQGVSAQTTATFRNYKKTAEDIANEKVFRVANENESFNTVKDFLKRAGKRTGDSSSHLFSKTRDVFSGVMDSTGKAFSYIADDDPKHEKLKQWKAERDAGSANNNANAKPGNEEHALAVVKKKSWDGFGAELRDMPFLNSIFDNPLFDRLLESEIAASIREMKNLDRNFQLEEFAEEVEYVVAPHIVQTYLDGDHKGLQIHCGEAAFRAVNASITARKENQLTVDATILAGPKSVHLLTAQLMPKGPPCFVWQFKTQQVNCMRNAQNEIIEGAIDDIRTVHYVMAVVRHPDLELEGLQYPWQVKELMIRANQAEW